MKRFFLLTLASAALLGASAAPVKTYEVKSPDGRLALVLTAGERLSFTVARDGETLVAPSEMALTLSTGEVLGESPRVRSARRRAVTETIDAPLYRQSRFDAAYNELDLRLRGDYGILARAYDDGVCYRFYTERDGELTIVDETAQLNFEGDPSAYIPYSKTEIPMRTSFENTYEYAPLSKFRTQTVAFMPVLVDEMNRLGVKDEDMKIVFALGIHRAMTHEEMVEGVGENVASRLKMYNSICTNDDDFEYFGTTSRGTPVHIHKELCNVDHVILTGTIVHHYFSGYGGGRKAILPGCAAMETVRVNHSFMLDENAALGRTTGNPCYEDQMEGVALFAKGRSAARIQEELFISKGTVSTHLRHIYQKMDVHSKQEMLDVIEGVTRE